MKLKIIALFFLPLLTWADHFATERKTSIQLFDAYINEINRLDGDGLLPRHNRKLSWQQITKKLRNDLEDSQNSLELGRVFSRLDAAYPNLHAHIKLGSNYDFNSEGKAMLAVGFKPEVVSEDGIVSKYLISSVKSQYFIHLDPKDRPQTGDELIAINGVDIKKWADENFEYCKFPLRSQCELEFWDNLRKGNLSWFRRQPLKFSLRRDEKKINVIIPVFANIEKSEAKNLKPCGNEPARYPEFKMVYQGFHACVYENKNLPGTSLLRIRSFRYDRGVTVNGIDGVSKEVQQFATQYWNKKAKQTKHLIIDVVDNWGGDVVTQWSAQFLDQDFQDQWVQFKKTKELEDPDWRNQAFYQDKGKLKIYENLRASEKWNNIREGEYIPTMPQFCPSQNDDCLTEKFSSIKKAYKGRVSFLTDPWCISSCVGFVWTLKYYLKERAQFVGLPDSGDSTYSRSYLEATFINQGQDFKISVHPRPAQSKAEVSKESFFRSAISTSRSTDELGQVISGTPMKMNHYVSIKWNESQDEWVARLIQKASDPAF